MVKFKMSFFAEMWYLKRMSLRNIICFISCGLEIGFFNYFLLNWESLVALKKLLDMVWTRGFFEFSRVDLNCY